MKKMFMVVALAWFTAIMGHAESYDYLVLRNSNGEQQSLSAMGLKITFRDGCLVAQPADGEAVTVNLADMAAMHFSTEAVTAVTGVTAQYGVRLQGRSIVFALPANGQATVATPAGVTVAQFHAQGQVGQFATGQLPRGIYIVKTDSATTKISVR